MPMSPEEQSAAYRASCTLRRRGHIVEELDENGAWKNVDLHKFAPLPIGHRGVGRAKRYCNEQRAKGVNHYVVR